MVASEFFTADLPCVAEIIFQDPDLMRYLFSFVQADQTLNFLLAGYFLKAYESCLNSNPEEFFMIIYQESYHIAILKHLKSSSRIHRNIRGSGTLSLKKLKKQIFFNFYGPPLL